MSQGKDIKKFVAVLLIALSAHKVFAGDQFTTAYNTHYDIQPSGKTHITQEVTITNLQGDIIADTYSLTIKQMQVHDIEAVVNGKSVEPKKEKHKNATVIKVGIDNHAIGAGRQNKIFLSYKTDDIASKFGEIWNINIPKTNIAKTTTLYNVKISVPKEFGPKIFMSPNPTLEKDENGKSTYHITKEDLLTGGITASFGKYQILNFRLKYQIENPSIFSGLYKIALPPDILHIQQVQYDKLNPEPKYLEVDADGNTIATYKLSPKQKLEVVLTGKGRVSGRQINPNFGGTFDAIPKKLIKLYTKEQKYWDVKSPNIQELAKRLKDENLNVAQNARKAYDFIIERLKYDTEAIQSGSVERKGAEKALTQKESWTCMEFTDLFIAVTRAMGIPAREIDGYAFVNEEKNKPLSIKLGGDDLLHAWAEIYDPFYGWLQVDPTWGNTSGVDYFTKLDTNHFAFVIKGKSSEYPMPAGTYRFSDSGNLVDVEFARVQKEGAFTEKLILYKKKNFNPIQILKKNDRYTLENSGSVIIHNVNNTRETLPPGGKTTIYLPKGSTKVTYTTFNGEVVEKELVVLE